jgi:hypothetical protein
MNILIIMLIKSNYHQNDNYHSYHIMIMNIIVIEKV